MTNLKNRIGNLESKTALPAINYDYSSLSDDELLDIRKVAKKGIDNGYPLLSEAGEIVKLFPLEDRDKLLAVANKIAGLQHAQNLEQNNAK